MGVTSGTFMGRDDGYPEQKERRFKDIDAVAKSKVIGTFGPEEEWFQVEYKPVNKQLMYNAVTNVKKVLELQAKREEIQVKREEIQAKREQIARLEQEIASEQGMYG